MNPRARRARSVLRARRAGLPAPDDRELTTITLYRQGPLTRGYLNALADGPFSALAGIVLKDPDPEEEDLGQPSVRPMSGFRFYLINKYGPWNAAEGKR